MQSRVESTSPCRCRAEQKLITTFDGGDLVHSCDLDGQLLALLDRAASLRIVFEKAPLQVESEAVASMSQRKQEGQEQSQSSET